MFTTSQRMRKEMTVTEQARKSPLSPLLLIKPCGPGACDEVKTLRWRPGADKNSDSWRGGGEEGGGNKRLRGRHRQQTPPSSRLLSDVSQEAFFPLFFFSDGSRKCDAEDSRGEAAPGSFAHLMSFFLCLSVPGGSVEAFRVLQHQHSGRVLKGPSVARESLGDTRLPVSWAGNQASLPPILPPILLSRR